MINEIMDTATVYSLRPSSLRLAHLAVSRYQMSIWDALIWAVTKENGVAVIYTEDLQSAEEIEGVRYINPFSEIEPA